ncbi:hypothetical protein LCGC14_2363580, partial [marine sediment metagenome]
EVIGAMGGGEVAPLTDSELQRIGKAVADEQYRRQRE